MFYRIFIVGLLSFTVFYRCFIGCSVSYRFVAFYTVLLSFTGFFLVIVGSLSPVLLGFTEFLLVFVSCSVFYRIFAVFFSIMNCQNELTGLQNSTQRRANKEHS